MNEIDVLDGYEDLLVLEIDYEDVFSVVLEIDTNNIIIAYSISNGKKGKSSIYKNIGNNKNQIIKMVKKEIGHYNITYDSITEIIKESFLTMKTIF